MCVCVHVCVFACVYICRRIYNILLSASLVYFCGVLSLDLLASCFKLCSGTGTKQVWAMSGVFTNLTSVFSMTVAPGSVNKVMWDGCVGGWVVGQSGLEGKHYISSPFCVCTCTLYIHMCVRVCVCMCMGAYMW